MSSVVLSPVEPDTYLNSFCFGFRISNFETLNPRFARYLFRSPEFRKEMGTLAQGITRYNISKTRVLGIECPLPDQAEQAKIADFLSAIDAKIDATERALESLKEYKRGLLQQMFV